MNLYLQVQFKYKLNLKTILFNIVLLTLPFLCFGQQDIFIDSNAHLTTFSKSQIGIFSNVINNSKGGFNHSNGGDVYLYNHSGTQKSLIKNLDSSYSSSGLYNQNGNFIRFWNLHTDNTFTQSKPSKTLINKDFGQGAIEVRTELQVTNTHYFENGIIWTPRSKWKSNYIHYQGDSAKLRGNDNQKHIDGYAVKSGNNPFEFPIGDGKTQRKAKISPNATGISKFRAAYFNQNPQLGTFGISGKSSLNDSSKNLSGGLIKISKSEFWDIDGTDSVLIGLESLNSFKGYSNLASDFSLPNDSIAISGFDGKWNNLSAKSYLTNHSFDGFVYAEKYVIPDSNFSAFTWGEVKINLTTITPDSKSKINWITVSNPSIYNTNLHLNYQFSDPSSSVQLILRDFTGKLILQQPIPNSGQQSSLDLPIIGIAKGLYLLTINTQSTISPISITKKILID